MMLMESKQKYQETYTGTQISLDEVAVFYPMFHFNVWNIHSISKIPQLL